MMNPLSKIYSSNFNNLEYLKEIFFTPLTCSYLPQAKNSSFRASLFSSIISKDIRILNNVNKLFVTGNRSCLEGSRQLEHPLRRDRGRHRRRGSRSCLPKAFRHPELAQDFVSRSRLREQGMVIIP